MSSLDKQIGVCAALALGGIFGLLAAVLLVADLGGDEGSGQLARSEVRAADTVASPPAQLALSPARRAMAEASRPTRTATHRATEPEIFVP